MTPDRLKKWIFVLFISTLAMGLSACNNRSSDSSHAIIRFGISSAPVTLDPLQATDATSARINRLIYETLVEFGEDDLPVPGIASWQQLSQRHYRFKLIKTSWFHHGKKLTANDVKATYEAVLDKKNASPQRNIIAHIQRIEVIDDNTIDFFLSRNDPLFPAFLTIGIMPVDQLAKHHPFNNQPVGSGPFKFSRWPFDGQLFLQRVSDGLTVEFLQVKDPTVRVLKLLRGELDIIQNNLPPEHIAYLKQQKGIGFISRPGSNYIYLGFNLQDPLTGDLQIRKAIAYALDKDKIIQYALGNAAQSARGFFPSRHWLGADLKAYDYNPDRARQIMQLLGYSEHHPLQLSYKTSSDPFRIRIATIIQSQLKKVYIDVDIRSYDWGTFYGDIKKGKFQLYSLTWVGIRTPDIFRYVFHSHSLPPGGANRGRLKDTLVDQLIAQAEQEMDLKKQAQLYRQLQKRLNKLLPYISLWYEDNIAFYRDTIKDYRVSVDGNYDGLITAQKLKGSNKQGSNKK